MRTVLIIDDDPIMVNILSGALSLAGYEVLSAANGQDGLDLAADRDPDVILLDLIMPGIDGLSVLQNLRARSDVPVVLMSAFGNNEKVEQARMLGIECFVNKPFRTSVITEILDLVFSIDSV